MFNNPYSSALRELASGFIHLAYPDLCVACDRALPASGHCFCLKCQLRVSVSDMYLTSDNEFTGRFWGRLPIRSGASMYYFTRKSPVQHALHQLKYRNKPDIGLKLGRIFGRLLAQAAPFQTIDAIVPVPLHPKRERLRGYNQSERFAAGLSEGWGGMPIYKDALVRSFHTETQTHKKRLDRFQNVGAAFAVRHPARLQGKHILLVDDVLTTGATLEMCGAALLQLPGTTISMATIAIAMHA
jgi:ComF family protein